MGLVTLLRDRVDGLGAVARWRKARTAVLTVAGFALISAAAFVVHLGAGLLVAGVSLLVIEWLSEGGEKQ